MAKKIYYDPERYKKARAWDRLLRNTKKMSVEELTEEGDKLWREKVKQEKMARARKRELRLEREAKEAALAKVNSEKAET